MSEKDSKIMIIILVDGISKKYTFSSKLEVEQVIKQILDKKEDSAKYQLSLENKRLDPSLTLEENGVKDGATLSLTKKDGGGGS